MNRWHALTLAGILLVLSGINPGVRILTTAVQQPSNFALLVGSSAKLECFTDTPLNFVMWSFAVAGTSTLLSITVWDGTKCAPSASYPQYQFNTTSSALGQCDLIINNVTSSQAGWYQCAGSQQVGGSYAFNAQVTVLYSSPQCSQNVTTDVAVTDAVSMKCDVSYSSSGANVDMLWSGCSYQTLSSYSIVNGNVTTKVHEIVTVAQQGDVVLSTCRCNSSTSNPPLPPFAGGITSTTNVRYSYVWTSQGDIPVQDCPTSVEMYPPSSEDLLPGSVVNCSASGYPTPVISLYVREPDGNVNVINGFYAELATPGVYEVICEAASTITSGQQGQYWCIRSTLPHVYNVVDRVCGFEPTISSEINGTYRRWFFWVSESTVNPIRREGMRLKDFDDRFEVIFPHGSVLTNVHAVAISFRIFVTAVATSSQSIEGPTTEVADFVSTMVTSYAPAETTWMTSLTTDVDPSTAPTEATVETQAPALTTVTDRDSPAFTSEETSETTWTSTTRLTTEFLTSDDGRISTDTEITVSRADTTVSSTFWPASTSATRTTSSVSTTAPSTTVSLSSTSGSATSSTQLTTTLPSTAPKLYPAPYVLVSNAGAMNASYAISPDCSNFISSDFRSSFQDVVSRMNAVIASGQLCVDSGGAITVRAGQIQNYFLGSQIQTQFNLLVGTNPADSLTIGMIESCSWDASQFAANLSNWRQPIISNIFNCPAVDVIPPGFAWQSSQWGCF